MTDRTAQVGLRVYLQDEISTGLVEISDWLLETGKVFADLGTTAGRSFNDIVDWSKLAIESVTSLNQSMSELVQSSTTVASAMKAEADAANAKAQADQQAAQAAQQQGDATTTAATAEEEEAVAAAALDAVIMSLASRYFDLYDATDEAAMAEKGQIAAMLETLGAGDALEATLMGIASAEMEVADSGNTANESSMSLFQSLMALQMGQQYVQQLDSAVKGFVTTAGDMQDSLDRVDIAVDTTKTSAADLNNTIIQLSDNSEFSSQQIADAFQLIGERGYDATAIVKDGLGQAVVNLATVTQQGLTPNINLLTTAMRDFSIPAKDAEQTAAALDYAFFHGIPNVQQMQSALEHVGPSAAGLKVPFSDIMATLIYLSQHGFPDVTQAGTGLNYMLQAMAAPTSQAGKDMAALGISAYDANGKLKSIPDMLQNIMEKMATLPNSKAAEDFRQMFNIRSGQVARILGLDPNIKSDLEKIIGQVQASQKPGKDGKDYLQGQVDKIGQDFNQSLAKLNSTWNSTMGLLFLPVIQWLTPILNNVNTLVTGLSNANPQIKNFIAILGGIILIAAPIAAVALGVAMLGTVLSMVSLPVLAVVGAILLLIPLGAAIAANWSKIQAFFAPLEPLFTNIGVILRQSLGPALQQMKDGWNEIVLAVQPLMAQLKPLTPVFQGIALVLLGVFVGLLSAIGPVLGSLIHAIAGMVSGVISVITGMIQFFKGLVQLVSGIVMGIVGLLTHNSSMSTAAQQMITKGLGNITAGIMHILQGALQIVISFVTGFITTIVNLFGHLVLGVLGVFGTFVGGNGPVGIINKTINSIIAMVSAFPAQVIKFIQNMADGVVHWFQHLADVLYVHSIVPDMVNAILGLFTRLWNTGAQLVGHLVSAAISIFQSLPGSVQNLIMSMINNIGSALGGAAGKIGGWVHSNIVKPIQDTVNGLINSAFTWGSNFINMLKNGIISGVQAIINTVSGMAQNIKNIVGFHSPTKEGPLSDSDQYMPNMMKMYASGILSHAHLVHGAVNHVANGIHSTLSSPVVARLQAANASASANGANGGNTVVNLNVDGKTVGTAVLNNLTGQMQLNGLNRSWR